MTQISKFDHLNKAMTKEDLQDRLHYVSGILADLVIGRKFDAADQWAHEAYELSSRLNQVNPN